MAEFDGAVALALRLIAKKGQAVTALRYEGGTPPDTGKPWRVGATPTSTGMAWDIVTVEYPPDQAGAGGGNTAVQNGDRLGYIPGSVADAPSVGDIVPLTGGGVAGDWRVMGVSETNPNGQSILFTAHLRRWPLRST